MCHRLVEFEERLELSTLISIVVPAFNEEQLITPCLEAIDAALTANSDRDFTAEVIVVDNNSSDDTAALARRAGARVVFEPVNQIARARNAGAAEAKGDWLLFVDADSRLSAELLEDIFRLIEGGRSVGCGTAMRMDGIPWWAQATLQSWNGLSRQLRWAAGALLLCRADAFNDVGGFNQKLYAGEEIELSRRLKKWGRPRSLEFVILRDHPLATSGRKAHLYTFPELAGQILRLCLRPSRSLRDKTRLSLWYDGRR